MLPWKKPNNIRFELTNVCNLRCVMCGIWEETPKVTFDLDLFERLLEDRTLSVARAVSLTGGEPFALKNLADYWELARKHHRWAHINVSSNGYYTEETLAFYDRVGTRNTSLTLSYDGLRSHDRIRGVEGSAERLLATTRRVRSEFPKVGLSLKMVVTNENHDEILDTARQCQEMGVAFRFKTLEKLNCHQGRFPSPISGPEYPPEIVSSITRQSRAVLGLGIETNRVYVETLIRLNEGAQVTCNCSPRTLFLGIDGQVFLCRRKQPIGNVHDRPLAEIWNSSTQVTVLAEMRNCPDASTGLSYSHD
jgi:MoaA/NifB/PqqE/SkfB family radical SAM enzyme